MAYRKLLPIIISFLFIGCIKKQNDFIKFKIEHKDSIFILPPIPFDGNSSIKWI
jgi:hypothetical protein